MAVSLRIPERRAGELVAGLIEHKVRFDNPEAPVRQSPLSFLLAMHGRRVRLLRVLRVFLNVKGTRLSRARSWTGLAALLLSPVVVSSAEIRINEFVASNGSTLADADGDFADWIELRNFDDNTVLMEGWGLSDDPDRPFRWTFPEVELMPGGYLLVWASGKDRTESGGELHANFAISSAGEPLLLTRPDGTEADFVEPVALPRDVSFGRSEDDPEVWLYFPEPTPDGSNGTNGHLGFLEPPVPSVPPGPVAFPFPFGFSHTDSASRVRYTYDGSLPLMTDAEFKESFNFEGPVVGPGPLSMIPTNPPEAAQWVGWLDFSPTGFGWMEPVGPLPAVAVLRARALREGYDGGKGFAGTWFDPDLLALSALDIVSIISDPDDLFGHEAGIYIPGALYEEHGFNPDNWWGDPGANYFQRGPEWERPAHFEYFCGRTGQRLSAGHLRLRLHGGASRVLPQKSLRLYDRNPELDGGALDFPFFGEDGLPGYRTLILRAGGQDQMRAHLRDGLGQTLVRHLRVDTQNYRPARVFVNGEYWGIKNLRERIDEGFLEARHGVDADDMDRVSLSWSVWADAGDTYAYDEIQSFIQSADPSAPGAYDWLAERIDLANHIDYHAAHIFFANEDWVATNVTLWRARSPREGVPEPGPDDGRFRWVMEDLDWSMDFMSGQTQLNFLEYATGLDDGPSRPEPFTRLLRFLLQNERYRDDFILRFADLLNTAFHPGRTEAMLHEFSDAIAPEMPYHIARWGFPSSVETWEANVDTVRAFLHERPARQWQHLVDFFDLGGTSVVSVDVPPGGSVRVNSVVIGPDQPGLEDFAPGVWHLRYPVGFAIHVEAIPLPGHRFTGWADDLDAGPARTVVVSENTQLVPEFVEDPSAWPVPPHRIAEADYSFDVWEHAEPAGTYPPSMRFVQADSRDPGLDAVPSGFWTLPYNLSSRSRVVGLNAGGVGFLNTANAQDADGAGYVMGAVLALDTRGAQAVRVDWSTGTVLANERSYALRLQYSVGVDGPFRDVLDEVGQPVEYLADASGHHAVLPSARLPADALGQPYVELLWRYHHTGGDSGPRAYLHLNWIDVAAFSAELPDSPFWADAEPLDEETVWSPAFGYIHTSELPWIHTADHGWQLHAGDHGATGLLWDPDLGWLVTSPEIYPYFGRIGDDGAFKWLFYYTGTRDPRLFYVIDRDAIVSELDFNG